MSQRIKRKQLALFESVETLTDQDLRESLKSYNFSAGPITDSTRELYRKKLASLMQDVSTKASNNYTKPISTNHNGPPTTYLDNEEVDDEDDDTSDDDYDPLDLGSDSNDEYDEEDESEIEEEEQQDLIKQQEDNNMLLRTETSIMKSPVISRVPNGMIVVYFSLALGIIAYLANLALDYKPFHVLKPFKNFTKQMIILLVLSPIAYLFYRIVMRYMANRRYESNVVCTLVNDALKLLDPYPSKQATSIPVLHVRDTLLSASDKKSKKWNERWEKAEKFIEEHESRVRVEMINIDGEDFRAWRWIGPLKPSSFV